MMLKQAVDGRRFPLVRIGTRIVDSIMNASGCWVSDKTGMENVMEKLGTKSVVTKTCTMYPRSAADAYNEQVKRSGVLPVQYYRGNDWSINRMGMPNLGYKYYRNLLEHYRSRDIEYIISFDGSNLRELRMMLDDYSKLVYKLNDGHAICEINLGCPNIGGQPVTYNLSALRSIAALCGKNWNTYNNLHFGFKISPVLNEHYLRRIIDVLIEKCEGSITHIVASNTVPNCVYVADGGLVVGGLSGYPLKFIALSNVRSIKKRYSDRLKIFGCGGVTSDKDVEDYCAVGADGVQIGRLLME